VKARERSGRREAAGTQPAANEQDRGGAARDLDPCRPEALALNRSRPIRAGGNQRASHWLREGNPTKSYI
jgi:hypothetical protein